MSDAERGLAASPILRRIAATLPDTPVFLTGGSLRDRLLGFRVHDLDLVVVGDARAASAALAKEFSGKAFSLGRPPFVTWRVVAARVQFDIWSPPGGLREDILRRDFTVNALFWRLPRGPLVDLVDGREDLVAGRLRVVREQNLADDPLRVLRGLRLTATRPQLRLTAHSERQLARAAHGLTAVAQERVIDELQQLLRGAAVGRAVMAAARLDVFARLTPPWNGFQKTDVVAAVADELATLARNRGAIASGAADVALAVVAAPAAGFPDVWNARRAGDSLESIGLARRSARRIAHSAEFGFLLAGVRSLRSGRARELAVRAGALLPAALAWTIAVGRARGRNLASPARGLLKWQRRFDARPPLLDGEEIARLLGLPPGPPRALAAERLRLAQVRGDVRSAAQARAFLVARVDPERALVIRFCRGYTPGS